MNLLPWNSSKKLSSDDIQLIGVVGSAGKTSVAQIIHHILGYSGATGGMISSTGVWFGKEKQTKKGLEEFVVNAARAKEVSTAIKHLEGLGARYIILEIPHLLIEAGLVAALEFDTLVVTNLHVGSEIDGEASTADEQLKLGMSAILKVKDQGLAILNAEDEVGLRLAQLSADIPQEIYAAWCRRELVTELKHVLGGMEFKFNGEFYATKLCGDFQLLNVLQAIHVASKYMGSEQIATALNLLPVIAGRAELLSVSPNTIVDSAYQPGMTEHMLKGLRHLVPSPARLIVVGGAAGQRSPLRLKSVLSMAKYADLIVLGALDPRNDQVQALNSKLIDIVELHGVVVVDRIASHDEYEVLDKQNIIAKVNRVFENSDKPLIAFDASSPSSRYDAIDLAMRIAKPEDLIVILGKGDDTMIDFGDAMYEWSDAEMATEISASLRTVV
jgi:UDP-N-acetylmuramoyl-L-alanyl-D-glutamate--2,6-diaminopimelate ligase